MPINMSLLKEVSYYVMTSKLKMPIQKITNYGISTFSNLGARSWNDFVRDLIILPVWIG